MDGVKSGKLSSIDLNQIRAWRNVTVVGMSVLYVPQDRG